MNNLIKELAEQAGLPKYITREVGPTVIQKFAELLIRECASYINERTLDWDADLRWEFNDGSGFMDVDVTDLLNKHFGVK
jgi:hypothetical protein